MGPRILVAEDDVQQGALLQAALTKSGYEVDLVANGFEAVQRLRGRKYQVALLDYHLPDVDGLSAARLLGDLLGAAERPRLIAVTAAPDSLREKQALLSDAPFDDLVSKSDGLSTLMNAVAQNVAIAGERDAALRQQEQDLAVLSARSLRRRRMQAMLGTVPSLIMAAGFAIAFVGAYQSIQLATGAGASADRSATVGASTVELVNAVQDAELSQRNFMLTGSQSSRAAFDAVSQRVDQMLISRAPLTADASPGLGADNGPQTLITQRLRTLTNEASRRTPLIAAPYAVSNDAGNQTLALLREWALSVAAGSQLAVHGGLDAIANNLTYVLGILVFGAAYALSEGLTTFLRQWRRHKPLDLGLRLNAADAAGPVSLASVSAPIGASALPS